MKVETGNTEDGNVQSRRGWEYRQRRGTRERMIPNKVCHKKAIQKPTI